MSRVRRFMSAAFANSNVRFSDASQDQEHLITDTQSLQSYEVPEMKMSFRHVLPYLSPAYLILRYIVLITTFSLITYVLWQCMGYLEEGKIQQQHIENELNVFHQAAEMKLKQLNIIQESMKDKLENINIMTEQGSKRIKDMFTFSKSDLLREYEEGTGDQCHLIPLSLRFDCHPENGASESSCTQRGCCWNALHELHYEKQVPLDVPYCYYPKNWSLYKYTNFSKSGNDFTGLLQLQNNSYYKEDLPLIQFESTEIDDTTLHVKIFDPTKKRYEPPFPVRADKPSVKKSYHPMYELKMDENIPGFRVVRKGNQRSVFNSIGFGGFIFANQFLQISSVLPSHNIYGLGEHRANLKLNTNWQKFTMLNADQPPVENSNLYGSHPFYMVIESSGKAHGVLFLNSNPMDIILQPTPAITYRSIGGIFDMYFFMGPTPADVLKQYAEIVGKPFFPPYWSLGFHLCKYGYETLEQTKAAWQRTRDALIPFDTQWNDLDYMDKNNDFTYDKTKFKDLPKFVKELHDAGMHYIPLIDAGVSAGERSGKYAPFDEGVRRNVFVKDANSEKPFIGKVWNLVSTAWPDFTNPNTTPYYTEMMGNMHNEFEYDGAWIDMNEPSNFFNGHKNGCQANPLDNPPYLPQVNGDLLATKTLCMNSKQYLGNHYDLHNVYGTSQAVVVNHALKKIRNKRPFIISRSTWEGHGHYAGHWTGDVYSRWHDLRMSVPEVLAFSLFQIPMVGADICGFNGNTTEALCNRWMQLGAFYPFSRNHNSDDTIDQDPVSMGQLVVTSSRKALRTRYYLLPYLYTLFYRAHMYAETVARPLFIEFYDDPKTYDVDSQFLWGSCLMIVPVLEENKTDVDAYMPRGVWYSLYSGDSSFSIGKNYTFDAPLDTIPLFVRGGCILPVQEPSLTTTLSRQKPFSLLVALDERENAKGELYWDDGDSLDSIETKQYNLFEFEVTDSVLTSLVVDGAYKNSTMKLGKITVMGISNIVREVYLNGKEVEFNYDNDLLLLEVRSLSVDFTEKLVLKWSDRVTHEPTTGSPKILVLPKQEALQQHPDEVSTVTSPHLNKSATNFPLVQILILTVINFLIAKYFVAL
ncbi:lysosomal alpha-glucosidase-like isoform X2 [Copidosoma floridanum]|nr:lysosomal alpha-glucosidase-like isoform X2 [Copidosoma floridanum]